MEKETWKTRLHWKNRRSYALVIPPTILQAAFNYLPRTNQGCIVRPLKSESGRPAIVVEFE